MVASFSPCSRQFKKLRSYAPLLFACAIFPQLANAQNFWKPLQGPPAVAGTNYAMAPDSEAMLLHVAGTTYFANGDRWTPYTKRSIFDLPLPLKAYPVEWMTGFNSDTTLAYYGPTLYATTDFGTSWDTVLRAQRLLAYAARLVGSAYLVPIAGTQLCVTRDFFHTVDTLEVPAGGSSYSLESSGDTLVDPAGNRIYSSVDFGRSWKSVYSADSGFYLGVTIAQGIWLVTGERPTDAAALLAYSFDGLNWQKVRTPDDSIFYLDAIGTDRTLYGHVIEHNTMLCYRTSDFGANWQPIPRQVFSVTDNTIYSMTGGYNYPSQWFVSTDRGSTWDTVRTSAIVSVPFSMTSARDTTWLSTYDHVYFSTDDGEDWTQFGETGKGSLSSSARGAVWFNTVQNATPTKLVQMCQDTLRPPIPSGPGLITPSGNVWVSDLIGTGMTYHPGRLYESWDSGCSFWTWTLPIIPEPFTDLLPLRGDTVLFVSKYMIMRDDDLRYILDTVTPERGPETDAVPTGAAVRDSAGMVVVAMTDGKLFASTDGARAWWYFASPSINGESFVTHLAADPVGHLYAIDSNFKSGVTKAFKFDTHSGWTDITSGLERSGFPGPAALTTIWYENDYMYAGAWNMGLFRSIDPVRTASVREPEPTLRLDVSPNPAAHLISVSLPNLDGGKITLADVTGRIRDTYDVAAGRTSIVVPVERFESGNYMVMFVGKAGVISSKLTVVR